MRKIFLIIFMLLVIKSSFCQPVKVDILSSPKPLITNLSEIATDIEYIPLETTPNSIMGRILRVVVRGNFIYASTVDKILFCFDKTGKFMFSLNKPGRGPEEYEYIPDFDVNNNNTIVALAGNKEIILYRQAAAGFTFMKRIKLESLPQTLNFTKVADHMLLQYANTAGTNPLSKELIDISGKSVKKWPNYMSYQLSEKIIVASRWENTSYTNQDDLILKEVGNDTIFRLTGDEKLSPYIIFDTEGKRVTPAARADVRYYMDHMYEYFILQKLFGSERYLYYTASFNKSGIAGIYDQVKKIRYRVPEKEFFTDDLSGGVNFEPQYCADGRFYSWVDAIKFKNYASEEPFLNAKVRIPEKYNTLKVLAGKVMEDDNPILIVAIVK